MPNDDVKISIIIPVYNVESYLPQCLESVLTQSYSNFEVICIDDGSTDASSEMLDQASSGDSRMKVIHKENGGVSAARNDGIRLATGDYVFFADSDDWLLPNAVEAMAQFVSANPVDLLISDHVVSNGSSHRSVTMFSNAFETSNRAYIDDIQAAVYNMGPAYYKNELFEVRAGSAAPWHHLIKKDLIVTNGLYFEPSLKGLFDDGLFTLNVLEHAKTVAYIPVRTYAYREVTSSLTQGFNNKIQDKYPRVFDELKRFNEQSNNQQLDTVFSIRVFSYLNKAADVNYLHPKNKLPEQERYRQFKALVSSEPFASELRKVPVEHLGLPRTRLLASLLKYNLPQIYWRLKKLSSKRSK